MTKYFNGEALKQLRKNRGLTTTELAEKVAVSQSYISRFENNKAVPDVEMLGKILEALDSNLATFFYNEKESSVDLQELQSILDKLSEEERKALIHYLKVRIGEG